MKKTFLFFTIILTSTYFLFSCSNDDEVTVDNYFQVDGGVHYDIDNAVVQGFVAEDSSEENYYGISFSSQQNSIIRNVQLAIFFPFNQSIDGTYTIIGTTRNLDSWLSNYSIFQNNSSQAFNDLSAGTCTVERNSNNNFDITFSITLNNGQVVSGQYSGSVVLQEM